MSYRFRRIGELCADLRDELQALTLAGQPLFQDVLVCRQTGAEGLNRLVANIVREPAAVIVPGRSEQPKEGARNKRQTSFAVHIRGSFSAERDNLMLDVHDLADLLVERFMPASATKNTQKVIANVIWEPCGQAPLAGRDGLDQTVVTLEAVDFRRER